MTKKDDESENESNNESESEIDSGGESEEHDPLEEETDVPDQKAKLQKIPMPKLVEGALTVFTILFVCMCPLYAQDLNTNFDSGIFFFLVRDGRTFCKLLLFGTRHLFALP